MLESFAKHLSRLLANGSLPVSSIADRDRRRLQVLFDSGVIEEVRSGGGRRITLRNRQALISFMQSIYPSGLERGPENNLPPRGLAVAHLRDAKRATATESEALFLRGFGDSVLTGDNEVLHVGEWTRKAGVAALRLDDECEWAFQGYMAVVENAEVFLNFERLRTRTDLVLYAGGRLSDRVLRWLASATLGPNRILHFGDYDPVGIDEYIRLLNACPGRVDLYIPDDIEALFAKYGKRELLEKSPQILARLRKHPEPIVQRIVRLMDIYGVGLEQEILLLR